MVLIIRFLLFILPRFLSFSVTVLNIFVALFLVNSISFFGVSIESLDNNDNNNT